VSSEFAINPISKVFKPPLIVASLIALDVKNALVRTVKICAIVLLVALSEPALLVAVTTQVMFDVLPASA